MTSECFFECGNQSENLITSGATRIRSMIAASHQRGDNLHEELQVHLDEDLTFTIKCHKSCVSSYTSRTHIQHQVVGVKPRLKREPPPLKRLCRSELSSFVFKLHCIFCGETCSLEYDPSNPSRWRAAYLCKTASCGTGFQDSILEVCGRQKDAWANQVEVRLQGAISDLHAAEVRYHDSCRKNFMLFKIIEANTYASTSDTDLAFDKLVEDIISKKSNIWTSSEVHENYLLHGGKGFCKAVFAKLQKHFDDMLVVFSSSGLSSLLVFHDTVPSVFKLEHPEYQ